MSYKLDRRAFIIMPIEVFYELDHGAFKNSVHKKEQFFLWLFERVQYSCQGLKYIKPITLP